MPKRRFSRFLSKYINAFLKENIKKKFGKWLHNCKDYLWIERFIEEFSCWPWKEIFWRTCRNSAKWPIYWPIKPIKTYLQQSRKKETEQLWNTTKKLNVLARKCVEGHEILEAEAYNIEPQGSNSKEFWKKDRFKKAFKIIPIQVRMIMAIVTERFRPYIKSFHSCRFWGAINHIIRKFDDWKVASSRIKPGTK